ncbi:glycosyltransferase [Pontibacter populi]|uniref:Glycosyltransferase family 1 protein n=1 Tax=Pontibacter populi TaxID=890055 RepID=A0ABV1RX76_9BACT
MEDLKHVKITTKRTSESVYKRKDLPVLAVDVAGKKIIYDTLDGYRFDHDLDINDNLALLDSVLDQCDFYFKRSYSHEYSLKLKNKNVYPLGLNYKVYNTLYKDILEYRFGSKSSIKALISYNRHLAKVFNIEFYKDICHENLSMLPLIRSNYSYEGSMLFLTRVWDPYELSLPRDLIEERKLLNESRADVIRKFKKRFGKSFIGGFFDDQYSRMHFPDLVIPKKFTSKSNYLNLMKSASICIATTGLHGSIGWKLGEYVACSKVVLSEPLEFVVGDGFLEGKNYISCTNNEMLNAAEKLLNQPDKMKEMMFANKAYYEKYLRPDNLILRTLQVAGVL